MCRRCIYLNRSENRKKKIFCYICVSFGFVCTMGKVYLRSKIICPEDEMETLPPSHCTENCLEIEELCAGNDSEYGNVKGKWKNNAHIVILYRRRKGDMDVSLQLSRENSLNQHKLWRCSSRIRYICGRASMGSNAHALDLVQTGECMYFEPP